LANALAEAQVLLTRAATTTKFRNPALSALTGERLTILYSNGGLRAVEAEIVKLRRLPVLQGRPRN
jgi:hypothetical protein